MFSKTVLQEFLSVNSIVTIFEIDMKTRGKRGEAHDFYEFLYIKKGTHQVEVDKNVFTLSEGQLILYAPLSYHAMKEKSTAFGYIVSFEANSECLLPLSNKVITLSEKQKNMLEDVMATGEKCFEKYTMNSSDCGMRVRKNANMYELHNLKNSLEMFLIDVYSKEDKEKNTSNDEIYKDEIFEMALFYMKNNVDRFITIEEICKNCLISSYKLKELFKYKLNTSPMAYFNNLKTEKAKMLIKNSNLNFTQISEVLGFSTVHYFSRFFKKYTGLSPKEYIKNQKGGEQSENN